MAFPKAHGLTIAANGYIENMVVERLSSDPSVAEAGRIWFNTTEKDYKISTLDGGGGVIVRSLGSEEALTQHIADLASRAVGNSGTSLVGYDGQTGSNGQFSVAANDLDDVLDSIISKIDANAQELVDIAGGGGGTTLASLQTEIDNVETALGAAVGNDGTYVPHSGSNYIDGNTNLTADILDLDAQIQSNANDISDLQSNSSTNSDQLQNLIDSFDELLDSEGSWQGFQTSNNYLMASSNVADAFWRVDQQMKTNADGIASNLSAIQSNDSDISSLQTEVNKIETAMGNMVDANGDYVAHTGTNYIDGNNNVAEDLTDLDSQVKTNTDGIASNDTDISNLQADKVDLAGDVMGGNLSFGDTYKVTNLAAPTEDGDAATKGYVDGVAQGLDVKESVRVATTAALPGASYAANVISTTENSPTFSIDGITLSADDRILVKNESTLAWNGIYTVTAVGDGGGTTWEFTRADDADGTPSAEVSSGMFTFVEEGSSFDNAGFVLKTENPITVGTTGLEFVQFSGAGQISAGVGIVKSGNVIDVNMGAGIVQLPTDEVGVDIYTNGGLWNTLDGVSSDSTTNAQLSVRLDTGNTNNMLLASTGLRVNPTMTDLEQVNVDNLRLDANTISTQNTNGDMILAPNGTGSVNIDNVDIGGGEIDGVAAGANSPVTELNVDNIRIDANTVSSRDINGDINLTPNGTGSVVIPKVDVAGGEIDGTIIGANAAAAGTFTQVDLGDMRITPGTISTATLGGGGDINLLAEDGFEVNIPMVDIDGGTIDGVSIGNSSVATEVNVDNLKLDGNTLSTTDANGNLILSPNGSGAIRLENTVVATGAVLDEEDMASESSEHLATQYSIKTYSDAIREDYNALIYTFQSGGASSQHVISHGLDSQMIEVQVWVQDDDTLYKSDLVGVTVNSNSQITVDLTESRMIRAVVRSSADLEIPSGGGA